YDDVLAFDPPPLPQTLTELFNELRLVGRSKAQQPDSCRLRLLRFRGERRSKEHHDDGPRAGPQNLNSVQEAEHKLGEALRLLEWREVPAAVQDLEARPRDAVRVRLAIGKGQQAVLAPPHDEGRCSDPPEPARELPVLLRGVPEKP